MKSLKGLGLILAAGALTYLFLGDIQIASETRSGKYFKDFLHFPLGALFYAFVHICLSKRVAPSKLFVGAIVAQGLFELLQPHFGRSASWVDLILALMGMLSLWSYCGWLPNRSFLASRKAIALGLLVLALIPVWALLADEKRQLSDMPQLAHFEHRMETGRWEARAAKIRRVAWPQVDEGYALELVVHNPNDYPGVVSELIAKDWSSYTNLNMTVYLAGKGEVFVHIRLDDTLEYAQYPERVEISRPLVPGKNHIDFDLMEARQPNGELFDLSQVYRIIIHLSGAEEGTRILLDAIQLQ